MATDKFFVGRVMDSENNRDWFIQHEVKIAAIQRVVPIVQLDPETLLTAYAQNTPMTTSVGYDNAFIAMCEKFGVNIGEDDIPKIPARKVLKELTNGVLNSSDVTLHMVDGGTSYGDWHVVGYFEKCTENKRGTKRYSQVGIRVEHSDMGTIDVPTTSKGVWRFVKTLDTETVYRMTKPIMREHLADWYRHVRIELEYTGSFSQTVKAMQK